MNSSAGALRRAWPGHSDWDAALAGLWTRPEWAALDAFVAAERCSAVVHPDAEDVFAAFALTPLSQVRVVLLGQDPYHGPGQAHGLSFSVRKGCRPPPSLRNVLAEVKAGGWPPPAGDLTVWARQGVLLLNTLLTVRAGQPLSHRGKGWEWFTAEVLKLLVRDPAPKVFLLWGNAAREMASRVGAPHLVLEAAHPSPLSARRGFHGCRHFELANQFLRACGRGEIDWGCGPGKTGPEG